MVDGLNSCQLQDLDEDDPGVLEPFQKMLQFALEPLLLYVDPVADQPGGACMLHDFSLVVWRVFWHEWNSAPCQLLVPRSMTVGMSPADMLC